MRRSLCGGGVGVRLLLHDGHLAHGAATFRDI